MSIKDKIKRVLTPFLNAVITAEEDEWIKVEIETIVYDMLEMYDRSIKTTLERWAELLKIDGGNTKHQVLVDLEKFIEYSNTKESNESEGEKRNEKIY